jgi:hypothetical protein
MDLNSNNIIWSKGPINDDYSKKQTELSSSTTEIQNIIKSVTQQNNILFIRNGSSKNVNDLDLFADNLHLLNIPIILITSDGDRSMPQSHDFDKIVYKLLMSNMIIKWYTQNYDKSINHPKLSYFPIGFDLHTSQWLVNNSISEKIKFMIKSRNESPTDKRISNKILSDSHLSITHPDRIRLYKLLKNNKAIDFIDNKLSFSEITNLYNKYNFALSPRGNGLDCHRTWELLLAGVIVITKTSSLDDMYKKNNLPVVILQYWCELNDNLEDKLNEWYNMYIDKTSIDNIFPKLTFDYWLKS